MLWAYLAFDQFLIIWAGNLQDEIPWYTTRAVGGWAWVVLFGANGFWAGNLPDAAFDKLAELQRQGRTLRSISFAADGGFVILYGDNSWFSSGAPASLNQRLHSMVSANQVIKSVSFTRDGGWVVLFGRNGSWYENIPFALADKIGDSIMLVGAG